MQDKFEPFTHYTVSLLLGYNKIRHLEGLSANVLAIRGVPQGILNTIMWLDLQHNHIVTLPKAEFDCFPHLKSLYLHRNYIIDLRELENLKDLHNLMSLTIHGNPVDRIPHFR